MVYGFPTGVAAGGEAVDNPPGCTCAEPEGRMRAKSTIAVFTAITAIVILSQYYRASLGVIAPELARDVALTPESLGLINGSFFITLALAQIPIGMAFDRFGPRWTITALTTVAVIGSLWFSAATSAETLLASRIVIGLGCAGSFMGAVVLT